MTDERLIADMAADITALYTIVRTMRDEMTAADSLTVMVGAKVMSTVGRLKEVEQRVAEMERRLNALRASA